MPGKERWKPFGNESMQISPHLPDSNGFQLAWVRLKAMTFCGTIISNNNNNNNLVPKSQHGFLKARCTVTALFEFFVGLENFVTTRSRQVNENDLYVQQTNLKLTVQSPAVMVPWMYNNLPTEIKEIENYELFNNALKTFLLKERFYDIHEFLRRDAPKQDV
jgi:hypothetical protein